jgi:hypothetical protein
MPSKNQFTGCWPGYKASLRRNMTPRIPKSPYIEEEIRTAMAVPEPDAAFLADLRKGVVHPWPARPAEHKFFLTRPVWAIAGLVLVTLVTAFLVIGPQQVVNAMGRLLGYIPGWGIVDRSAPLRVLAEPVSLTRDGVTVSVNQGALTADKTVLDYNVSGVPLSASPKSEAITGCIEREYLLLPDGTRQDLHAPIPANVNDATFVMPCIFNTLPGSVPTDWELPLHFVPAPPDLTVMPVIELTSIGYTTATISTLAQGDQTGTPLATQVPAITFDEVVETNDGYILVGWFRPNLPEGARLYPTGSDFYDAAGKKVKTTHPQDIDLSYSGPPISGNDTKFAIQFQAAGIAFPVTFSISGEVYVPVDPQATAEATFDAGPDPQAGQVWTLNQDIQLGGHTITLASITANADGYSFQFDNREKTEGPDVQIEGFQAMGAGGGGDHVTLIFAQMPKGKLKLILSNLFIDSGTQSWETQWQPASPRTDWPTPTTQPASACLTEDTVAQLSAPPASLTGKVLFEELSSDGKDWSLMLANLDGSQKEMVGPKGTWGSLSPDGTKAAYSGPDGTMLVDLASGKTTVMMADSGYDIHWSPDGTQVALANPGSAFGVFVANADGSNRRQLSNLGYESIAGWSPDGRQVYFAVPGSTGDGFLLKAADVASGSVHDLFVLKDSSRKAPMPTVSPDGKWIAYRGSDNASLYLMSMDGSQPHLVMDKPADAISGLAWSQDSAWLGVSLMTPEVPNGQIVLVKPEGCQAYLVPGLVGNLDGLVMP